MSTILKLQASEHSQFFEGNNNCIEFEKWNDFVESEDWDIKNLEDDFFQYNTVLTFNIRHKLDDNANEIPGEFELWIYIFQHRWGQYKPIYIEDIKEKDMPEITAFLQKGWDFLKSQWPEFV